MSRAVSLLLSAVYVPSFLCLLCLVLFFNLSFACSHEYPLHVNADTQDRI